MHQEWWSGLSTVLSSYVHCKCKCVVNILNIFVYIYYRVLHSLSCAFSTQTIDIRWYPSRIKFGYTSISRMGQDQLEVTSGFLTFSYPHCQKLNIFMHFKFNLMNMSTWLKLRGDHRVTVAPLYVQFWNLVVVASSGVDSRSGKMGVNIMLILVFDLGIFVLTTSPILGNVMSWSSKTQSDINLKCTKQGIWWSWGWFNHTVTQQKVNKCIINLASDMDFSCTSSQGKCVH